MLRRSSRQYSVYLCCCWKCCGLINSPSFQITRLRANIVCYSTLSNFTS
ncbi:Uncharacterised protein [Vibrio cholerae]|nr:Uncharacterised protein [Vibrio cholerae]CSH81631.1 Uncharacterised protein [Vibrio cholerae]